MLNNVKEQYRLTSEKLPVPGNSEIIMLRDRIEYFVYLVQQ